jgi:hypothetical protein
MARKNSTTGNAIQNPRLYETSSNGALEGDCSDEAISPCVAKRIDLSALARKTPLTK